MKLKRIGSFLLSLAMILSVTTSAYAAEGEAEVNAGIATGAAAESALTPILEFDFSDEGTQAGSVTTIIGKAGDEEVTATAQGITFANGIATFPADGALETTGITYTPVTDAKDPMKNLSEDGATISMWVKTGQDTFNSTLFAYGGLQDEAPGKKAGELGESIQILGRNNPGTNKTGKNLEVVYYRDASGSTAGQKLSPKNASEFVKDTWQLVTFVENADGSSEYFIDGVLQGSIAANAKNKTLKGYATDGVADVYYIGFLPYAVDGDAHFVGAMDSVSVYATALAAEDIAVAYQKGMLQYAVADAKSLTQGDYTNVTWAAFQTAIKNAEDLLADDTKTATDIKVCREALVNAQGQLKLEPFPKPILKFEFSEVVPDENTDVTTTPGTVVIQGKTVEVSATVENVEIKDGTAVFADGEDTAVTGITYSPEQGKDPLAELGENTGASISMWIKTAQSDFSSPLFAYGALQTTGDKYVGELGASLQVLARNNREEEIVYYRRQEDGSSKDANNRKQVVNPEDNAPYKKDRWQHVAFVEGKDGYATLYIDGVNKGTSTVANHTLREYATDNNKPDKYYIGYLPYDSKGDTRFVGAIGGVNIYGEELSAERVQRLYEEGVLEQVLAEAVIYYGDGANTGNYTSASWKGFKTAYDTANAMSATAEGGLATPAAQLRAARIELTNAMAELKKADSAEPILKFDFEKKLVTKVEETNEIRITGITSVDGVEAADVVATAKGITVENGIATFPRDAAGTISTNTGITYIPAEGKDPMAGLGTGAGATVSMWIRTGESEFSSSLFTYGALQGENGKEPEKIGAALQILGRNKDDNMASVYNRMHDGYSGSGSNRQAITTANKTPYKQEHWQLVTYVEEVNGTMRLYVDGVQIGERTVSAPRTLHTYATDEFEPDQYYIGFLPYFVSGDAHFVGDMDEVAVYGAALTSEEIKEAYEIGQLSYAITESEYVQEDYTANSWAAYQTALEAAKNGAAKEALDGTEAENLREALAKAENNLVLASDNTTTVLANEITKLTNAAATAAAKHPNNGTHNHTDDSWKEYQAAYTAAQNALLETKKEDSAVTAGDLIKLNTALAKALKTLDEEDGVNEEVLNKILEFTFDDVEKNATTVTGTTSVAGITVTAKASGVTFENGMAIFPEDDQKLSTGITYEPGEGKDPMTSIGDHGATIAMWVKNDAKDTDYGSHLFAYGARQSEGEGELGASVHMLAKTNDSTSDKGVVYYRNETGRTEDQKLNIKGSSPFKVNTWQLVVLVENADGTNALYVDGQKVDDFAVKEGAVAKKLSGFATDKNKPDIYYIGCLPYKSANDNDKDAHLVGCMDSLTIYDKPLTEVQIADLYGDYKDIQLASAKATLREVLKDTEAIRNAGQTAGDYTNESWDVFEGNYDAAVRALNNRDITADVLEQRTMDVASAYANLETNLEAKERELKDFLTFIDDNYKESKFSPDSWSQLELAITSAKAELAKVEGKTTTAQKLQVQIDALAVAVNGLVDAEVAEARTKLQAEIDKYKNHKEADYEADSWKAFHQALTAAKSTVENTNATAAALDQARTNLEKTAASLLPLTLQGARQALMDAVAAAGEAGYVKDDAYTAANWTKYETALNEAKNVSTTADNNNEAKLKELKENLVAAETALLTDAKASLAGAVTAVEAKGYQDADYTKEAWAKYQAALVAAKAPTAAKAPAVLALKKNLAAAETALLTDAKNTLAAAVAAVEAKAYVKEDYTAEAWAKYQAAYAAAKVPIADATAAELVKVKKDLAVAETVLIEDAKAALAEAVTAAEANAYVKENYTKETWAKYQTAYEAAKAPKEGATAAELIKLKKELEAAESGLATEQKGTIDAVVKAAEGKGYAEGDYSEEAWNKYQAALTAAKEIKLDATAAEMKEILADLAEAEAALGAEATTALSAAVSAAEEKNYKEEDYIAEGWATYKKALAAAKEPKSDATAAELMQLKAALVEAEQKLKPVESTEPNEPSEPSKPSKPSEPSVPSDPTQPTQPSVQPIQPPVQPTQPPLTEQENKIAAMFGVAPEVAKQIAAVVTQYNIPDATLKVTDKSIQAIKNEKDVAGSSFARIQARAAKRTDTSVTLKWNKVSGADGYVILGNECGKKRAYETIATVAGKTSYKHKSLEEGTYYKYIVRAYKDVAGIKVTLAASKSIHTVTKGGEYGVEKKVNVKPGSVKIKVGKKIKLSAEEVGDDKPIKLHRKLQYETSNPNVATVTKKGQIKAIGKGKCYIYVYAQNGIFKKVKVTVK